VMFSLSAFTVAGLPTVTQPDPNSSTTCSERMEFAFNGKHRFTGQQVQDKRVNMNSTALTVTIISSLLSGIVGVILSALYYRRYDALRLKRDVFRRFAGNRFLLTAVPCETKAEPFIALNETFIVFADSPRVIAALKKMHEELTIQGRLVDNIITLMKAMGESARVPMKDLNDSFLQRPFTPGKGSSSEQGG